ncbi:MAG: zinc ribbon domain-containing protein [Smithellaceae bacterium]
MKEQLLLIIELQECDSQLVKIADRKRSLPEKMDKLDEQFRAFQKEIEQNKRKYDEIKARHVECENKIRKINEGMIKTKERLLEVKNNKEYQAMLKENETAEAMCGDVETEIISILDELEKLAVLVKKDQAILDEYRRKYEEDKRLIEADLNSIDADFVSWEQKRVGLKDKVPADLLARYEKIKKSNNGIGVISVWKAVCNGCHMNIPPQLYNELQKTSELISCPNCHRIMYFQNMEKSV